MSIRPCASKTVSSALKPQILARWNTWAKFAWSRSTRSQIWTCQASTINKVLHQPVARLEIIQWSTMSMQSVDMASWSGPMGQTSKATGSTTKPSVWVCSAHQNQAVKPMKASGRMISLRICAFSAKIRDRTWCRRWSSSSLAVT